MWALLRNAALSVFVWNRGQHHMKKRRHQWLQHTQERLRRFWYECKDVFKCLYQ
jgi:hypothetical protein